MPNGLTALTLQTRELVTPAALVKSILALNVPALGS
jgi:hypothetical protein